MSVIQHIYQICRKHLNLLIPELKRCKLVKVINSDKASVNKYTEKMTQKTHHDDPNFKPDVLLSCVKADGYLKPYRIELIQHRYQAAQQQ